MTTLKNQSRPSRSLKKRAKYPQLVEWFTAQIRRGELEAGDRLPPFVELQSTFGMTPNTVNRAMMELEKSGLVERRHGSGVFVAEPAPRSLTGVLGVSGAGFDFIEYSPYWTQLLKGLRQGARKVGSEILLLDHASTRNWEKADGVIICDWALMKLARLVPPQMPCLSLLVPTPRFSSVTADDYGGMRAATEYLISLGHRKIASLYRTNSQVILNQRLSGYQDALKFHSIAPDAAWNHEVSWIGDEKYDYGSRFIQVGRDTMRQWLQQNWKELGCTAIVTQNDEIALGVIEELQAHGIRVPEEVSVMGFDGVAPYDYFSPALTTTKVPLAKIGAAAVELLAKQLQEGGKVLEHLVFPVELQVRQSTAPPSCVSPACASPA